MTPHQALEGLGFELKSSYLNHEGRGGIATVHHYERTRPAGGKPVTQHVVVRDYHQNPGKYNVAYSVTQGPNRDPYYGGSYDHWVPHEFNEFGGSRDPIKDVILHHHGVNGALDTEKLPPLTTVGPHNMSLLAPPTEVNGKGMVNYSSVRDRWIMEKADEDLRP